jgi:hypothetical protein
MGLVEEGDDLISLFELGDFGTRFEDFARASEAGTTGTLRGKGYFPCMRIVIRLLLRRMKVEDNLWDDKVSVVQRRSVELDEDIVLADLGDGGVVVLETVKVVLLVLDGPLLLRGGCHF